MSGVIIGFNLTMYTVTEGLNSSVELCAVLLMGILEREVMVMFTISDGSATSTGFINIVIKQYSNESILY